MRRMLGEMRTLHGAQVSLPLLIAVLSLMAVVAVYIRSVDNYFQSDDFDWLYIYGSGIKEHEAIATVLRPPNPAVTDSENPFHWLYRPTTAGLSVILVRLFGVSSPVGYHAVLLILHLIMSALAGMTASRLTSRSWIGVAVVAIFGLHFAHVEAVAWFGSIAEVTAAVLGLATILAFLQFRDSARHRWAWAAITLYSLALGANPTAAPVIGILALIDLWHYRRGEERRWTAYWPYIPLVMLAGAYLIVSLAALDVASGNDTYGYRLGAHTLLNAAWYAVVLVGPFTHGELFDFHRAVLAALDGSGSFNDIIAVERFAALAAHLAVIGAGVLVVLYGPGWARVAAGSVLVLETPFVLFRGTMPHFAYLPSVFVLTVGVAALVSLAPVVVHRSRPAHAYTVAAGLLLALATLLASQTHSRLDHWEFAAGLSHRIVQSAHDSLPDPPNNAHIIATGLPNTVNDAYVFREGFPAALRVTYGRPDLHVQVFSRPVFERLMADDPSGYERHFLEYEPESMVLKPA